MRSFIFSKHIVPRLARHLAFWVLYFAGVLLRNLPDIEGWGQVNRDTFKNVLSGALSDVLHFLPIYLLAVYSVLYLVLPIYLRKRKISLLVCYPLVVLAIAITAGYYITKANFLSPGYGLDELEILSRSLNGSMANLITITGAAVIIKIMKDYWLRQRENELLAIENIRNKLRLLKMQMHPRILFVSLQRIYREINSETRGAPEMILKLSDLLNYLLYESDSEQVPLSTEAKMIKNYLALKKLEYKQRIDIQLEIVGQLHLHRIMPGLILPLLEIGIERSGDLEHQRVVTVQLRALGPKIYFSLTSNTLGAAVAQDPIVHATLRTLRERLRGVNFQKFKLNLRSGPDSLTIVMQLEGNKKKAGDQAFQTVKI